EAGGDMIDEDQYAIRELASAYGLQLARILRGGFAFVRTDRAGRPRIQPQNSSRGWGHLGEALQDVIEPYRLAEQRWDTPITAAIARRSVASWLDDVKADDELRAMATGLRGFFLAEPEELSLVALADMFGPSDSPTPGPMYRIEGGNDRLATAI